MGLYSYRHWTNAKYETIVYQVCMTHSRKVRPDSEREANRFDHYWEIARYWEGALTLKILSYFAGLVLATTLKNEVRKMQVWVERIF